MDRNDPPPPREGCANWLLWGFGCVLLLTLGFGPGFLVGAICGELGAYHRRYIEERDALAPVLAGDPAFAGVKVLEKSDGGVFLIGEVATPEDLGRLRAAVARALGENRSKEAVGTEVRKP
jgi:hypothetical protein